MNWSRIIKYCIILFIGTAAAAFPFGFVNRLLQNRGYTDLFWITIGQGFAVPFASIVIFDRLAFIQRVEPLYHALLVGIFCWLVSFPINVLLLNQPIGNWATGVIVISITALIGVGIGNFLHGRSLNIWGQTSNRE